jgi:hypothetical protein
MENFSFVQISTMTQMCIAFRPIAESKLVPTAVDLTLFSTRNLVILTHLLSQQKEEFGSLNRVKED